MYSQYWYRPWSVGVVQTAVGQCIVHHSVTLMSSIEHSSCPKVSVLVPWPGTGVSLSPGASCQNAVSVRAVNRVGLAGPAATVHIVAPGTSAPPALMPSPASWIPTTTTTSSLTSTPDVLASLDREASENRTEGGFLIFYSLFYSWIQRRRKQFESGGAQFPAQSAGKIFFTVPHHFFMVPPHMTGHYREVQGTVTRT